MKENYSDIKFYQCLVLSQWNNNVITSVHIRVILMKSLLLPQVTINQSWNHVAQMIKDIAIVVVYYQQHWNSRCL